MLIQKQLIDTEAMAEGYVMKAHPQIRLSFSLTEWMSYAPNPGLLPPTIGHTLTIYRISK